ncbi:MAG TPA: PAS domain S-box protein [Gaiellaceae bacterium]|nr:PAS domain S-box protein [Gaiellaceae bacterium]
MQTALTPSPPALDAPRAGRIGLPRGWQSRRPGRLSPVAKLYLVGVGLAAAASVAVAGGHAEERRWVAFAVLAALGSAAKLQSISIGRNNSRTAAVAFVVAGSLLLSPPLLALLVVVVHVPEWIRQRFTWYIGAFNIANYTLAAMAAWAIAEQIGRESDLRFALGGLGAAVAFVAVNHSVLALMLRLGRGHSLRESELFTPTALATVLVLNGIGVALAGFWLANPWLVPTLILPLALAHRSLSGAGQARASDERFRAMFDAAPIGVMLIGLDGTIMSVNRAYEEILGLSRDELLTLPSSSYVHPDDFEEGLVLFAELAAGEREVYRREARLVRPTGEVGYTQLAVALVRDADARPSFAISMVEDITERAELEERLRQAQKLEAIGRLAGGVAHDFNNMLTAIGGYTALALERLDESSPARDDLDEVRKATDRATVLTRQLLAFSRKQILQPELLNLNGVVVELEAMLRPLIGEDIVLATDFDPALGPIEADPGQLQQVVMNLVVNARDAMPSGGRISIETANADIGDDDPTIEPGRYVSLTVRDTGHGIDDVTLERIFEPFFTTKEAGKGTGLGLATVYGIVKQSGGYLAVDSELERGTSFTIYLPRVDEARAVPAVVVEPVEEFEPNGTVLLVEDEDVVRKLVKHMLEQNGFAVIEARDGDEAIEVGSGHAVDLLITDMVMPKRGGLEVATALRALRPELKVLFMSGYAEGAIAPGALGAGSALLEKPFDFATLTAKVRTLLDA